MGNDEFKFVFDDFNLDAKSAANIRVTIKSKPYIVHFCSRLNGNRYSAKTIIIEATVSTATLVFIAIFL